MSGFESIQVQGFRRLLGFSVILRQLNVLIGANGVGKTSLLEVFSLLGAAANGRLEPTLAAMGGLSEVMTRDRATSLVFKLRMPSPGHAPLDYYLQLAPMARSYGIVDELLSQRTDPRKTGPFRHIQASGADVRYSTPTQTGLLRPTWEHNPFETALSQVPKMYEEPERFRSRLGSAAFYGVMDVSTRSPVRLPQPMRPVTIPSPTGDDLVPYLYNLRETDPDRFETLTDTLRAAFPDFERLSFPPVATGTLSMTWKDVNFGTPLYMHQLSEGTLRFLWLTALLLSRHLPTVLLIDEPEVSLHPQLLRLVVALMREASQRTQLIVATHSDRFIRFLEPGEVLVCDAVDGETLMTRADSLDLGAWLADYSLDELWMMNVIGGRP